MRWTPLYSCCTWGATVYGRPLVFVQLCRSDSVGSVGLLGWAVSVQDCMQVCAMSHGLLCFGVRITAALIDIQPLGCTTHVQRRYLHASHGVGSPGGGVPAWRSCLVSTHPLVHVLATCDIVCCHTVHRGTRRDAARTVWRISGCGGGLM